MHHEMILAGFGGQGVLLMGQLLAKGGIHEGYEVTWMPAYGAEMRGGTSNCHVVLSDEPVSSPLVSRATEAVVMNLPSLVKFEESVMPGGTLFVNASLIDRKAARTDIAVVYVPASDTANRLGNPRVANMVMLGAVLKRTKVLRNESVLEALRATLGKGKEHLIPLNEQALAQGAAFA